jgi:8-oxo-dGTP pyrophosphatase MutT (NUDIX family)
MTELSIVPLARLSLAFAPKPWAFAHERRSEIDAYFAGLREKKPQLYNGRVLLLHEASLSDDVLRGACFETDYASFLAWRDWGFPDPMVRNCFAMGALRTADDAFLLGVMGPHTANAGRIYFPAGTPDPNDVRPDGTVDLEGSVTRELGEETGLTPRDYRMEPGWMLVPAGPRYALFKLLHAPETAEVLRRRVLDYLAAEQEPELAGVHIVRSPADLNESIPPFMGAFIRHMWR